MLPRLFKRCSAAALLSLSVLSPAFAKDTLHVAHDQWIGYSGFFVANAKGFFDEADLEIKTTQFSGPGDTIPPLIAGHIDVGLTTLYNLALAAGKGESSLNAVYLLDTSNGADAVVAAPEVKSVADLKGKRIAVTTGEVNHLLLTAALQSANLTEADVKLVNMNADDAGAALLAGRVDAAVTWEPWVTRASASGGHALYTSADAADLILDSIVVTDATLEKRRDAIVRFIQAVSPEDAAEMLAGDKVYGIAENKVLLGANGKGYDSLAAVADFLAQLGLINQPVDGQALLTGDLLP